MPTHAGPNPALDSNIVFSYDTGDTSNSYKGEPTTNTVGNLNSYNPLDLYTWASTGNTSTWSRDTSTPLSPVKGIPLKEVSSGTDSYSDTYNTSQDNISAASSGQTWTVSVYALANAGTNLQIWIFGANSSGNYVELAVNGFTSTGQWQRISVTMTFSNGSTAYVQSRVATSTNGGVIWWDGLQVEQKPNPTQFTTGTRSATQGLLPLISNTSLNISTVSFNSNAQIVFDGTDDYINAGSIQPFTLSSRTATWETVVKFGTSSGAHAITTKWNNSTGQIWWFGRYPTTKIHIAMIINGNYYAYYSDGDLSSTSNYYHIVVTLNDTILSYYINGVLDSTDTVAAGTWATDNGNPDLIIGAQNAGTAANFNGSIPLLKMYNTALSSDQVKQNYQQYKTRFNLS